MATAAYPGVRHIAPAEGETVRIFTETVTFKVRGVDTGGAYSLILLTSEPGGGPPGMHTHPAQETFYILSGDYEFSLLDEAGAIVAFRAGPGSAVEIPGGVPHNFTNVGQTRGTMLFVTTPDFEGFFDELGALLAGGGPPDMEQVMAIHAKHRIAFVGPDPAR
jgi:quercetin dioxygenase-like cupin family protein